MIKLNQSEKKVIEIIEKYGNYVAVTYEKRMYNASNTLIKKGLVVVTEEEQYCRTVVRQGCYDSWYQFKIVLANKETK